MSGLYVISKVAPDDKPKKNNFIRNDLNVIKQSKYLIIVEAFLGINRLYLLQNNRFKKILSNIYCLVTWCVLLLHPVFTGVHDGTTNTVLKYIFIFEYSIFVFTTLTLSKHKFKVFFKNMSTFDVMLNIQNDLSLTSSMKRVNAWLLVDVLCILCETVLLTQLSLSSDMTEALWTFFMTTPHDLEQIFFFTFLRDIYMRVLIVKAHVAKLFDRKSVKKLNKIEKLSEKKQFDVSSLHRVYELLHKCSEQLNSTMNIPILTIFMNSAVTTILLLKELVSLFQTKIEDQLYICYIVFRCLKYTLLVVIPCYYSSVTGAQTSIIRIILHDAVNTLPLDKTERRKVKTFFHLTRESDFSYALCGVIKLNMSLPLSYMSLCTTYLVIIIQFSKFID